MLQKFDQLMKMGLQELVIPGKKLTPWRATVALAMVSILAVFGLEIFYHPGKDALLALEFIELAALLVLFVDLAVNFSRAENKSKFIRKNWFELFLFVPFAVTFEAFRAFELFQVMGVEAMPFMMRTRVIVKGGHVATHIGKSEPARIARGAILGVMTAPDRYKSMRYRGLLSFG
ncbi:MAG: hypothetical protein ABIF01_00510 [Candidatus Micrarchaeota archaeon]